MKTNLHILTSALLTGSTLIPCLTTQARNTQAAKPNIILIMADDMGYSDLGCYGGEIATPALDALAANGMMMTQFYNNARSCPTRASLLTGLTPHQAGVGWMVDRHQGYEGYAGNLTDKCTTLAEVLRSAGYSTYMSGKWHVTSSPNVKHETEDRTTWPRQRGFDRFFGIVGGAANYWKPSAATLDNEKYPGELYFLTDMIGDYGIRFVDEHTKQKKENPFFLYLTFNAPHWPLHARPETINKYSETYKQGWDSIRMQRYRKMVSTGVLDPQWALSPRDENAPAWNSLSDEQQSDMARRMAVYAAQVDEMDQKIGQLIQTLKQNNQFENTAIIFLTDNGACAEFISSGKDKTTEGLGSERSWESYRLPWANVSATPFRLYKHWMHEGGISTPLIIHWGQGITDQGRKEQTPGYLPDIMATFVELSGASYPSQLKGNKIPPMEGVSLVPLINHKPLEKRYFCIEHEANRMVRYGEWKLVEKASYSYPYVKEWELYNIDLDRTELNNVAKDHPKLVAQMSKHWQEWANTHKVMPLDGREHSQRIQTPICPSPQY